MANDNKKKEVRKEDVVKNCGIYNEHFSEKTLVTKAADFVYNYLFQNDIYGEGKWEGDREVYGKLPFGDTAVYVVKTKDGKVVKANVIAIINPDEETITLRVQAPGCKCKEKMFEHMTIKHGYINWQDQDAPDLDIEFKIVHTNCFKDDLPKYGTVKPKLRQQHQIPLYMLPYSW